MIFVLIQEPEEVRIPEPDLEPGPEPANTGSVKSGENNPAAVFRARGG